MATKNLQDMINGVYNSYIDEDGKKVKDRVQVGTQILDRATCTVEINSNNYLQDLIGTYKQDNNGVEPTQTQKKRMEKLSAEVLKGWRNEAKSNKILTTLSNSGNTLIVKIDRTEKEGTAKASPKQIKKNKNAIFVRNFQQVKKINDKICTDLINGEYRDLFIARSKKKDGNPRAPADIGHVHSLSETGQAGLMLGELTSLKDKKNEAGDFILSKPERAVLEKEISNLQTGELGAIEAVAFDQNGLISKSHVVEYKIQGAFSNRSDQAREKAAGKEFFEKAAAAKNDVKSDEFMKRPGSPSMIDMVASSIIHTKVKTNMYNSRKAKNMTKFKKLRSTKKTNKVSSKKREMNTYQQNITGLGFHKGHMGSVTNTKSTPTEKGQGTSPEQFANQVAMSLKIKNAINKRLPAQVRRNMGKPALTNRTGRFSNSAIVENITPAAKTLLVKYSYRLNPYETFEPGGNKRWPSGYNPKPLISKSIRGLALEMFQITQLTTRRV